MKQLGDVVKEKRGSDCSASWFCLSIPMCSVRCPCEVRLKGHTGVKSTYM